MYLAYIKDYIENDNKVYNNEKKGDREMSRAKSIRIPDSLDQFVLSEAAQTGKTYTGVIIGCIMAVRDRECEASHGEERLKNLCEIIKEFNKVYDECPDVDLSALGKAVNRLWL